MAVDPRLHDLRGPSRREFLRWSGVVAALLGLERSRYLNVLSETAGVASADTASCATTNRSISFVGGNGGVANFQLLWPQIDVATSTDAANPFHANGKAVKATGVDKDFYFAPESPWQKTGKWRITGFMAGTNETHTATPQSAATVSGQASMLAAIASIQQANPTLLPVIAINPLQFGAAPGAPAVATVQNAEGLVDLFNSAASRALLQAPENSSLAEAYYKAFLNLNAAAGRSTTTRQYATGKVSMNLLGKNLADQLRPTPAEEALFFAAGANNNVVQMSRAMITAVKAFKLNLTSALIVPAFRDDPHGLFAGGDAAATTKAAQMGKMFDGLQTLAGGLPDPACGSKSLGDNLVITVHGDTVKSYNNRNGWPDGTPNGSNILWVMGNGYLKTGWFGKWNRAGNTVSGWDSSTGENVQAYNGQALGNAAAAAALFAIAKGDARRVSDFGFAGKLDGVVNLNITG